MSAKAASEKWADFQRDVLAALDIQAELELLGVRTVPGNTPNAAGWLVVRAMGRPDNHPSAQINVGVGPSRGAYRDFGGEHQRLSFFDFCAEYGPFDDWKEARSAFAAKAGVKPPRVKYIAPKEAFKFSGSQVSVGIALAFCGTRPGISADILNVTGARPATYNVRLPAPLHQSVLVWNQYDSLYEDAEPCGYHAARVDGSKVAIHQVNKNEPTLSKTVSKGKCGVMNEHALNHFQDASTVIWVEGLTDMLAGQTVLGAENTEIVMPTLGSASMRIPEPVLAMNAGKQVIICYDNDEAGEMGAGALAAKLLGIAASVKIVRLPPEFKDLRNYLVAGHDMHDFMLLADNTPPMQSDSPEVQVTLSRPIMEQLGVEVLGTKRGTQQIAVYVRSKRSFSMIENLDRFSYIQGMMLLDCPRFQTVVAQSIEHRQSEEQLTMSELRAAIAEEASLRVIDTDNRIGQGVWKSTEGFVLINGHMVDQWNGSELEELYAPISDGRLVETGPTEDQWYNRDRLVGYLEEAKDPHWRAETMTRLIAAFQVFDNWQHCLSADLLAGLSVAALFQSCFPSRPQVAIHGGTNTGKSTLAMMMQNLFGPLGRLCSAPSESGLRQSLGKSSRVMLVDEFDTSPNQKALLSTIRNATRGGAVLKGSKDGVADAFLIRNLFFCFGIKFPLSEAADLNRFIQLRLDAVPINKARGVVTPTKAVADRMREKMLAVMLTCWSDYEDVYKELQRISFVEPRVLEILAVPVGILAVGQGWTLDEAKTFMGRVLSHYARDYEELSELVDDEMGLIKEVLHYPIRLPRGGMIMLGETVEARMILDSDGNPVDRGHVEMFGVRKFEPHGEAPRVFLSPVRLAERILRDRKKASEIRTALKELKGVRHDHCAFSNGSRMSGYSIPLPVFRALMMDVDARHRPGESDEVVLPELEVAPPDVTEGQTQTEINLDFDDDF